MNRRRLLPLIALLTLVAVPAAAQTAYKSTMPDGRVIYGDAPIPGARKVEQISVAAPRLGEGGAGAAPGGDQDRRSTQGSDQNRARQQDETMRARMAEREQARQRVREAEEALRVAEEAKRNGDEPLPGERLGLAGGGSRLSEEYFQRQKQLEENVVNARSTLEQARRAAQ
jgi:hypothetical protein